MEVIIKSDRQQGSVLGAKIIAALIRRKPKAVLGLATGSTPLMLYNELVRMYQEENLSFADITTFNLDEYVGLDPNNKCSFASEMYNNLFCKVDLRPGATRLPDGMATDIPASCQAYENAIAAAGGIDLQLLGIGTDGHLAFNEPGSSFLSRTRIKTLTHETIEANSRFFGSKELVPRHVLTMGLATIAETRTCLLLAFGKDKADAVYEMIEGPISASWPATMMQYHPNAIIILDEDSAGKLKRQDYYKEVYAGKPVWQRWE